MCPGPLVSVEMWLPTVELGKTNGTFLTETYLGKSEHETTGIVVPLEGEGDFQSQQREGTKQCRTWIYLGLTGVKSKGQKSGCSYTSLT